MTPEQIKGERQLSWMRANLPQVSGPTVSIISKRRKVLIRVLSNIYVDDEGCMIYRSTSARVPQVNWPVREKFTEDRRAQPRGRRSECMWPGGCRRRPADRKGKHAKHPLYCLQPDPDTSVIHDGHSASAWRISHHKPQKTDKDKSVPLLLLELYAPDKMKNIRRTVNVCGKNHCVTPAHHWDLAEWARDSMKRNGGRLREKYDRETVREVVRLRLDEELTFGEITAKTGVTESRIREILKGTIYARYTEDILDHQRAEEVRVLAMERGRRLGSRRARGL